MTRGRGFTLVEVLVATAVFAIGLLAVVTAFSLAARVSAISRTDTTVVLLAEEKLTELRGQDPRSLPTGTQRGRFAPDHPDYTWELTVRRPDARGVVPVVLVIRAPSGGKTREFRFTTALF